jgi:hypothetical protein
MGKTSIALVLALLVVATGLAQTIPAPASIGQATNMVSQDVYMSPARMADFWNDIGIPYVLANGGGDGSTTNFDNINVTNTATIGSVQSDNYLDAITNTGEGLFFDSEEAWGGNGFGIGSSDWQDGSGGGAHLDGAGNVIVDGGLYISGQFTKTAAQIYYDGYGNFHIIDGYENGTYISSGSAQLYMSGGNGTVSTENNTLDDGAGAATFGSVTAASFVGNGSGLTNISGSGGQPPSATLTNLSGITTNQIVFTNNIIWFDTNGAGTAAALAATNNFGKTVAVNMTNQANLFTGNGGGLTNISGTNIQVGTINSNKLDAGTIALLGGSVPNGLVTNNGSASLVATNSASIGRVGITNGTITGNTQLVLQELGDQYGGVALLLQNRDGINGVIFQDLSLDLVDFVFQGLNNQRNIRYENRFSNYSMALPEFEIGLPSNPTLVIADNGVMLAKGVYYGNGSGLTNIPSTSITGGMTTNLQFTDTALLRTNTLYFTNGILMRVTSP